MQNFSCTFHQSPILVCLISAFIPRHLPRFPVFYSDFSRSHPIPRHSNSNSLHSHILRIFTCFPTSPAPFYVFLSFPIWFPAFPPPFPSFPPWLPAFLLFSLCFPVFPPLLPAFPSILPWFPVFTHYSPPLPSFNSPILHSGFHR